MLLKAGYPLEFMRSVNLPNFKESLLSRQIINKDLQTNCWQVNGTFFTDCAALKIPHASSPARRKYYNLFYWTYDYHNSAASVGHWKGCFVTDFLPILPMHICRDGYWQSQTSLLRRLLSLHWAWRWQIKPLKTCKTKIYIPERKTRQLQLLNPSAPECYRCGGQYNSSVSLKTETCRHCGKRGHIACSVILAWSSTHQRNWSKGADLNMTSTRSLLQTLNCLIRLRTQKSFLQCMLHSVYSTQKESCY